MSIKGKKCLKDVREDLMANLLRESGLSPTCFASPADFGTLQDFRDWCHRDFSISDFSDNHMLKFMTVHYTLIFKGTLYFNVLNL